MLPPAPTSSPVYADVPPPPPPPGPAPSSHHSSASPDIVDEITNWLNRYKPSAGAGAPAEPPSASSSSSSSQPVHRSPASPIPTQLPDWFYMGASATNRTQPPKPVSSSSSSYSSSSSSNTITPIPATEATPQSRSSQYTAVRGSGVGEQASSSSSSPSPSSSSAAAVAANSPSARTSKEDSRQADTGEAHNRQMVGNEIQVARENERVQEVSDTLYDLNHPSFQGPMKRQQQQQPKRAGGPTPSSGSAPWLESRFGNLSISIRHSPSPTGAMDDRAAHMEDGMGQPFYDDPSSSHPPLSSLSAAAFLSSSSPLSYLTSSSLQSGALTPSMRQELRMQKKYQQPWRRSKAHPAALRAHANAKRQLQMAAILQASSSPPCPSSPPSSSSSSSSSSPSSSSSSSSSPSSSPTYYSPDESFQTVGKGNPTGSASGSGSGSRSGSGSGSRSGPVSASNTTTNNTTTAPSTKTTIAVSSSRPPPPPERREIVLPHDILSHIFSYFDSRANAQQYYDKTMPSDLVACSRVNMSWRIAALEKIWQTILIPDPMDPSCRKLLYLIASSYSAAKTLGRSYNLTDLVQRVEIDLIQSVSVATGVGAMGGAHPSAGGAGGGSGVGGGGGHGGGGPFGGGDPGPFCRTLHALLRLVAPFRTLSIQLPQEIDMSEAEGLTKTWSTAIFAAVVDAVEDAKIQELDMPSAMYCTVKSFPGMLNLIMALKDLRTLILGYSSRDWPLLRAILGLSALENLCIFDSCWSNQIWIYLLGTLGTRLRGLSIVQGRRPLEGAVLREGIAPYCRQLTTLAIPFIPLFQGSRPVLVDEDLIPVLKACHGLQVVNLSGQQLLGDGTLEALAELWGLEWLDIRGCQEMTGKTVKRLRWQSIQRVRVFGCDSLSTDFLNLVAMVWQSQRVAIGHASPPPPAPAPAPASASASAAASGSPGGSFSSKTRPTTTAETTATTITTTTPTTATTPSSSPPTSATAANTASGTKTKKTVAWAPTLLLGNADSSSSSSSSPTTATTITTATTTTRSGGSSPHMSGSGVGSGRSSATASPSPLPPSAVAALPTSIISKTRMNPPYLGMAVLDFKADHEDSVEMGWVRQREDEPPLDVDEDHFFAEWYR
ncbi:hypothetical protein DFQ27_008214 [Actinomortierella ambigua]|uniref:F-box domain-containing protein n=1 Tax=Actinomortierella ambigua TaxID=1343610 RepID=A0A9P6TYQ0_9FUNG|nr:hypothetical protein DFQ27_008214 [Actinomortierella ambigua]